MRSVGLHSTSGREKGGKDGSGSGPVVSSVSWLGKKKENTTCEWDDGGKIGNKNK